MSKDKHSFTVAVPVANKTIKLCKIVYGSDGSYYVSVPYHAFTGDATLVKMTVNYEFEERRVAFSQSIDFAKASGVERAIKLSHHPDGFVQFSGEGILSGPGKNGLSTNSWKFDNPISGPVFAVFIRDFETFKSSKIKDVACIFELPEERKIVRPNCARIEGFYFPSTSRKYSKRIRGREVIQIMHPSGKVLDLQVLEPPNGTSSTGFLAIGCWFEFDGLEPKQFLNISSSTGNYRFNELGQRIGDGLFCIFPAASSDEQLARSLNYVPPAKNDEDNN